MNFKETEIKLTTRTPEQLKKDGVTMRNLKGEFIK